MQVEMNMANDSRCNAGGHLTGKEYDSRVAVSGIWAYYGRMPTVQDHAWMPLVGCHGDVGNKRQCRPLANKHTFPPVAPQGPARSLWFAFQP